MIESRQTVPFLTDRQHIAPTAEHGGKIPFAEEPVVMAAMHHPVARPPFAGMMLEPRRKTGQQEIAARLEQRQDAVEVPPGVGARHMVEAAVINEHIEHRRTERQREQVRRHKPGPVAGSGMLRGQRSRPFDRQRFSVDADDPEAPFGGVKGMAALAAPEVKHPPAGQTRDEPAERRRNARFGTLNRPAVLAALIRLTKIPSLPSVHVHRPQSTRLTTIRSSRQADRTGVPADGRQGKMVHTTRSRMPSPGAG